MAAITVSPAVPGDAVAIAGLLRELDEFYDAPFREPAEAKVASITAVLFGDPARAFAVVARDGAATDGAALAGIACYSFAWPAVSSTKSLYLKELYVRQSHRGSGAGRLLMAALAEIAIEAGCSRLEWTTDRGNHDAQAFYERLGVPRLESKVFYRAEGPALRAIAGGGDRT
jgi:GNAT superfamily N-acetyltransferase